MSRDIDEHVIKKINELGCHVRPTPQHFLQPLALESHGKQQVKPQSSSPSGRSALITTSPATRSGCIDTLCWNTAPATSPGAATAAVTAQEGRHSSAGHIFGTTSTSYTSLHKVFRTNSPNAWSRLPPLSPSRTQSALPYLDVNSTLSTVPRSQHQSAHSTGSCSPTSPLCHSKKKFTCSEASGAEITYPRTSSPAHDTLVSPDSHGNSSWADSRTPAVLTNPQGQHGQQRALHGRLSPVGHGSGKGAALARVRRHHRIWDGNTNPAIEPSFEAALVAWQEDVERGVYGPKFLGSLDAVMSGHITSGTAGAIGNASRAPSSAAAGKLAYDIGATAAVFQGSGEEAIQALEGLVLRRLVCKPHLTVMQLQRGVRAISTLESQYQLAAIGVLLKGGCWTAAMQVAHAELSVLAEVLLEMRAIVEEGLCLQDHLAAATWHWAAIDRDMFMKSFRGIGLIQQYNRLRKQLVRWQGVGANSLSSNTGQVAHASVPQSAPQRTVSTGLTASSNGRLDSCHPELAKAERLLLLSVIDNYLAHVDATIAASEESAAADQQQQQELPSIVPLDNDSKVIGSSMPPHSASGMSTTECTTGEGILHTALQITNDWQVVATGVPESMEQSVEHNQQVQQQAAGRKLVELGLDAPNLAPAQSTSGPPSSVSAVQKNARGPTASGSHRASTLQSPLGANVSKPIRKQNQQGQPSCVATSGKADLKTTASGVHAKEATGNKRRSANVGSSSRGGAASRQHMQLHSATTPTSPAKTTSTGASPSTPSATGATPHHPVSRHQADNFSKVPKQVQASQNQQRQQQATEPSEPHQGHYKVTQMLLEDAGQTTEEEQVHCTSVEDAGSTSSAALCSKAPTSAVPSSNHEPSAWSSSAVADGEDADSIVADHYAATADTAADVLPSAAGKLSDTVRPETMSDGNTHDLPADTYVAVAEAAAGVQDDSCELAESHCVTIEDHQTAAAHTSDSDTAYSTQPCQVLTDNILTTEDGEHKPVTDSLSAVADAQHCVDTAVAEAARAEVMQVVAIETEEPTKLTHASSAVETDQEAAALACSATDAGDVCEPPAIEQVATEYSAAGGSMSAVLAAEMVQGDQTVQSATKAEEVQETAVITSVTVEHTNAAGILAGAATSSLDFKLLARRPSTKQLEGPAVKQEASSEIPGDQDGDVAIMKNSQEKVADYSREKPADHQPEALSNLAEATVAGQTGEFQRVPKVNERHVSPSLTGAEPQETIQRAGSHVAGPATAAVIAAETTGPAINPDQPSGSTGTSSDQFPVAVQAGRNVTDDGQAEQQTPKNPPEDVGQDAIAEHQVLSSQTASTTCSGHSTLNAAHQPSSELIAGDMGAILGQNLQQIPKLDGSSQIQATGTDQAGLGAIQQQEAPTLSAVHEQAALRQEQLPLEGSVADTSSGTAVPSGAGNAPVVNSSAGIQKEMETATEHLLEVLSDIETVVKDLSTLDEEPVTADSSTPAAACEQHPAAAVTDILQQKPDTAVSSLALSVAQKTTDNRSKAATASSVSEPAKSSRPASAATVATVATTGWSNSGARSARPQSAAAGMPPAVHSNDIAGVSRTQSRPSSRPYSAGSDGATEAGLQRFRHSCAEQRHSMELLAQKIMATDTTSTTALQQQETTSTSHLAATGDNQSHGGVLSGDSVTGVLQSSRPSSPPAMINKHEQLAANVSAVHRNPVADGEHPQTLGDGQHYSQGAMPLPGTDAAKTAPALVADGTSGVACTTQRPRPFSSQAVTPVRQSRVQSAQQRLPEEVQRTMQLFQQRLEQTALMAQQLLEQQVAGQAACSSSRTSNSRPASAAVGLEAVRGSIQLALCQPNATQSSRPGTASLGAASANAVSQSAAAPDDQTIDMGLKAVRLKAERLASLEVEEPPTAAEVREYAQYLGMDPDKDAELLYIAEWALTAPCPDAWTVHLDKDGNEFFYNTATQATTYEHPMDQHYRQMYQQKKQELALR